jgi:catalase
LKRLGGPNFHELPINKSVAPVHNHNRDGHGRQTIPLGRTAYDPNTTGGGCPFQSGSKNGGFVTFPALTEGPKLRDRSESFFDHFSQASMFYNSQSDSEKEHIAEAFEFELAKCDTPAIRERMIGVLQQVDKDLAMSVAKELGITVPIKIDGPLNMQLPEDVDPKTYQPTKKRLGPSISAALSLVKNHKLGVVSRKVAILLADGFDLSAVALMFKSLTEAGAHGKICAPRAGMVTASNGEQLKVDFRLKTTGSVLFDALFVPGGIESIQTLSKEASAALFVNETYMHCKAIAATGAGVDFIKTCLLKGGLPSESLKKALTAPNGIITSSSEADISGDFIKAMAHHRIWNRLMKQEMIV